MTRRRFLALGLFLGAAGLSGCAGSPGGGAPAPTAAKQAAPAQATSAPAPAAPAPAAPAAPAAASPASAAAAKPTGETPVPGGVLRMRFAGAPDTLDPQKSFQNEGYAVSSAIFDNLTQLDAEGKVQPMLATKWTPEKRAQEWVLELREGVKFHHGREFTADDVVASLTRLQDPANNFVGRGTLGPIKEVKAEAKNRVRLILDFPFAELPEGLASSRGRIGPADKLDSLANEPVGSGPFTLKDYQPGAQATLIKNPNYWMTGRPYVDEYRVITMKEGAAATAALQSGSIDAIFETTPEMHAGLEKVPTIKTFSLESQSHQVISMTAAMEPFNKVEVRQAFKYILDREQMLKALLLGLGSIGNDHPIPRFSEFWAERPQTGRDLAKAKALLAQAGVPEINLELWTSSERPPSQKMAVVFKELAEPAGIKVEIKDVPQAVYAADVNKKKPLYTVNKTGKATLYEMIYPYFHSKGGQNYALTQLSPKLDAVIEDLIAETDVPKRKALVAQAIDLIREVGHEVIPYFTGLTAAQTSKVKGFVPSPHRRADVRDAWIER